MNIRKEDMQPGEIRCISGNPPAPHMLKYLQGSRDYKQGFIDAQVLSEKLFDGARDALYEQGLVDGKHLAHRWRALYVLIGGAATSIGAGIYFFLHNPP